MPRRKRQQFTWLARTRMICNKHLQCLCLPRLPHCRWGCGNGILHASWWRWHSPD